MSDLVQNKVKRSAGRPRQFDEDAVLDIAINVFRSFGFDGATVELLTKEMGLNKPSFYRFFGGRTELLERAAGVYGQRVTATWRTVLEETDNIEQAVRNFFAAALKSFLDPITHQGQGCLFLTSITSTAGANAHLRNILCEFIRSSDEELANSLQIQFEDWFADSKWTPGTLAQLMNAGVHSIAIRSRGGASRAELEEFSQTFYLAIFQ